MRYPVLFLGDCEQCDTSANMMKLALHGIKRSATQGILNKDKPYVRVIPLNRDNNHNYLAPSSMNALKKAGITVQRIDLDGKIVLKTD